MQKTKTREFFYKKLKSLRIPIEEQIRLNNNIQDLQYLRNFKTEANKLIYRYNTEIAEGKKHVSKNGRDASGGAEEKGQAPGGFNIENLTVIININNMNDENLHRLFNDLKKLSQDSKMETAVSNDLRKLIETLERADKSKWRQHIQNFFSTAANVGKLASFGLDLFQYLSYF